MGDLVYPILLPHSVTFHPCKTSYPAAHIEYSHCDYLVSIKLSSSLKSRLSNPEEKQTSPIKTVRTKLEGSCDLLPGTIIGAAKLLTRMNSTKKVLLLNIENCSKANVARAHACILSLSCCGSIP
jgi:hypothetical protein